MKKVILIILSVVIFMAVIVGTDVNKPMQKVYAADSNEYNVKIMTFNIRNLHGDDGTVNSWDNRKSIAVNTINGFGPDILALNEAYKVQSDYFCNNLNGDMKAVGMSRYGNMSDEYCSILYRSDKFRVLESGQFWLSQTPEVAGSVSAADTKFPRICTWVKFQAVSNTSAVFYYLNTHFSTVAQAALEGAGVILSQLPAIVKDSNVPVFIGGDINCEETTTTISNAPYLAFINAEGFQDTWGMAGNAYTNDSTWHGFTGNTSSGGHIDWIFAKNITRVNSIEINRYNENGSYPSDHFPVQADVVIPVTSSDKDDLTYGGTATAQYNDNAQYEDAGKAFDSVFSSKYCVLHSPVWLQYKFSGTAKYAVKRYKIVSANDNQAIRDPKDWTLQGSNDGSAWTTVDTRTGQTFSNRFEGKEYTLVNTTPYAYYRFNFSSTGGSEFQVADIYLYDNYKEGATFYQDANYGGYAITLPKGTYTLAQLQAAGISNDDISSLKVFGGAAVELYWDNNFQGASLVKTQDDNSLTDDGWNDKVSSIKIY